MAKDGKTPTIRKILKVAAWCIMGALSAVLATIVCVLSLLSPDHLTIIANRLANEYLDAQVTIGRVEIGIQGHAPLLSLRMDGITVLSKPIMRQTDRQNFPEWADTLLTLDRMQGAVNLPALFFGRVELHDVEFDRPGINLLTVNDSVSSYRIYTSEEDTTSTSEMPQISINRFTVKNPKPLRFVNLMTRQEMTLDLDDFSITGENTSTYAFKFGGELEYPELSPYKLNDFAFGVNGSVDWNPSQPTSINISNFNIRAGCINADINAQATIGKDIVVGNYSLFMYGTPVTGLMDMIPDSIRQKSGVGEENLSTDMSLSLGIRSNGPFNLTTDSIPNAEIEIELIPGALRYDDMQLHNVSGKIFTYLRGNDIGRASVVVENLNVAGPSTDLLFNLQAYNLTTDPVVSGSIAGETDLGKLPSKVKDMLDGYIRGKITADISFRGKKSMLDRNNFHKISVDGDIDAYNVYYLSADTTNMLNLNHACLIFGTHTQVKSDPNAAKADSMLTAVVEIDSADFLHTEYSVQTADVKLAVGVLNQKESTDTTLVLPMGGQLSLGKFSLLSLGDSLSLNLRKASGHVTVRRFKNMGRVPELVFNMNINRMSTGSEDTKFMLNGAKFNVTANKLPSHRKVPKHIKNAADSIHRDFPDIPMDSVYRRAIEIQRAKHKHHGPPRVHPEYTAEENEIIDWGTSTLIRRLLLEWRVNGHLSARRAGLFTPYFPIRNRLKQFNLDFNNDSIKLTNVQFKVGNSDFLLSGIISNMKRGLTSKGMRSPLRMNFDVLSDTIDINQLADATFRGSAYAADDKSEKIKLEAFNLQTLENAESISDDEFEREMGKIVVDAPDEMAPLMVPVNLELNLKTRSQNIMYSDLMLKDFSGDVLVSQGGLNLNNLHASSDFGSVGLSALYSSPRADDIKFGFGLNVQDFNIHRFIKLVPAVDSIMPLLNDVNGIIDAQIAATCDIDSAMNIVLPTLEAAIRISGDSLELIDKETYRNIGKWLLFKNKQDNIIKHMDVELVVKDNVMTLYPFIFDIDRYKLGVQGYNDLNLNFDYHVAVLKSPIPFKFGINIKGDPEHYKIRLGRARLNEKIAAQSVSIVDTTRINLLDQIQDVFRRGVNNSRFARLQISERPMAASIDLNEDTISRADSLLFIQEGLIPAPLPPEDAQQAKATKKRKKKTKDSDASWPMLAVLGMRHTKKNRRHRSIKDSKEK